MTLLHTRIRARDKALAYLDRLVLSCTSEHTSRLPTLKRMAADAGVSHQTMWDAVAQLKARGRLLASPRRGITLAHGTPVGATDRAPSPPAHTQAPTPVRPSRARPRAAWVAEQLTGAALTGKLAPGVVYRPKELRQRLGVCHRTLSKALAELVAQRMVVPHQRGYMLAPVSVSEESPNTVVLYMVGNEKRTPELFTPMSADVLRALEQECLRARLNLRMQLFDFRTGQWLTDRDTGESGTVLGYVLWTMGIPAEACHEVAARAASSGKPVCILGNFAHASHGANRYVRRYDMAAGGACGEHVGHYLLRLGHRRVAYVSTVHATDWSRRRAQGLTEAYARAGLDKAVDVIAAQQDTGALLEPRLAAEVDRNADVLAAATGWVYEPMSVDRNSVANALVAASGEVMGRLSRAARVWPLLDSTAFCSRGYTAVVGANDAVAVAVLNYLGHKRVPVPGAMSVIGFDDELEAVSRRLTSYDFNCTALVRAMLAHVVRPTVQQPDTVSEVEGFIVERGTTRSCVPGNRQS